jgi:hypothetical protein
LTVPNGRGADGHLIAQVGALTYITQIVLNDGRRYRIDAAAIPTPVLAATREILPVALEHGRAPMSALHPELSLHAEKRGPTLLATVHGPVRAPFDLVAQAPMMPLISIGVAPKSRGASDLWRALVNVTVTLDDHGNPVPIALDAPEIADGPPGAPWLGVAVHLGFGVYPETHAWMARFEQAIAVLWAGR